MDFEVYVDPDTGEVIYPEFNPVVAAIAGLALAAILLPFLI